MFDNQLLHIPKYYIKNIDNYYFDTNNKLYNVNSKIISKQVVKGGLTRGYNLNGKFYSFKKLKPLLIKIKKLSNNFYYN